MKDKYRAAFFGAGLSVVMNAFVIGIMSSGSNKVHAGWPIIFGPIGVVILIAVIALFDD